MTLEELRKEIDETDCKLIELLGKRKELVREVGKIKKESGVPVFDAVRWKQVVYVRKKIGKAHGIPERIIERIWEIIHGWSLEVEDKV